LTFVIPGDLGTRTGGYGYDRRIIAGLRALGRTVDVVRLDDSFPFPTPAARDYADRAFAAIPDGRTVLVDGLALGALPEEVARHAARLTIVALVHHPLAAETGLETWAAEALEESERHALASVHSVVVTSRATAAALARYGVAPDRVAVVEPGTDAAPLAHSAGGNRQAIRSPRAATRDPRSRAGEPLSLLCVAMLTPRKGHEVLLRALASITARNWRLTCAGSLDRDAPTAARVRALLVDLALEDRVALVGDMDAERLAVEYDRADLFVLPTWHEGYGMAVAEALARGVPVISTATGAIPELVGARAGIVVPPGDQAALAEALSHVLGDASLRQRLAEGARMVRDRLPTWDAAAAAMARALDSRRG
jgi:glycosyltransferase involved in cell wall biosynthesis